MIEAHMKVAEVYSKLSKAKRLQVGAIVVKENRVISIGYNGTPAGWDNSCEHVYYISPWSDELPGGENITYVTKTKAEVIHAEANAIAKLAKSSESGHGADMFITHAPCMECAKLIYGVGIKNVYFKNLYRESSGVEFLERCGITVKQVKESKC